MWIEIIVAVIGISVAAKILPSFVLMSRFAYPNAKFSAISNAYIKEKEVTRLLESKNLEDLKNNVVSRDFVLEGNSAEEIQKSIDRAMVKIIRMAKDDSPPAVRDFYDAYLQRMDGENIKKAIREVMEGKEVGEYVMFSEEGNNLMEKIKRAEREELEEILRKEGFNISLDMSQESIEREIDRVMILRMAEAKMPKSCVKARDKFAGIMVDVINLKTLIRGKHYGKKEIEKNLIEGGWEISEWKMKELLKIDSVAEIISMLEGTSYMPYLRQAITDYEKKGVMALENALDKYMIKAAGEISNECPMGIGPGIRFMVEKEYEARNLKAIAKAIEANMREEAWNVVVVV